ncbi:MAG: DnaB-like helicase N-terminal domain-containing protein, partial [Bdellovibrionota bacterium]
MALGPALPHSIDAEKAVLGAILSDPDSLTAIEGSLAAEHYFLDSHQKIYSAILELSRANEAADIVTVSEKLRQNKHKEISGAYLIELTECAPITQNLEHYAQIVRNHFYRRSIMKVCLDVVERAGSYEGKIETFIELVEKQFLTISGEYDRKGIIKADIVLESTIEEIQRKLETDGSVTGVTTGFNDLDSLTGGMQGSDLVILAARPGMGKTA